MLPLSIAAALFSIAPAATANTQLLASVASVDITPPLEMKASLGGYGERMNRPATGIHDRIWAKALVLRQDNRRFVIVTADMLALPPGFKAAVLERLNQLSAPGSVPAPASGTVPVSGSVAAPPTDLKGFIDSKDLTDQKSAQTAPAWSDEQVLLLASHSHTSIDMSAINPKNDFGIPQMGIFHPALFERTRDLFARVIADAAKGGVPCKVATQSVILEGWNHNRRRDNTATQPELTVTRFDSDAGPVAVLVNWTAHPTFMDADAMMYSGDWPGQMQRTLEAIIGHGVTAMYFNGAEGDQSPIARPDSGGDWEKAERYGREIALKVMELWHAAKPAPNAGLEYHLETINLPARTWHPDFMKTGGAEYGLSETAIRTIVERLVPATTHSVSVRIGDLVIAGVPGELASLPADDLKAHVRKSTGLKHVVVGGLADEWISYMLAPSEYRKGGYEASMCFYGEGLAPAIIEGVSRGAARLK